MNRKQQVARRVFAYMVPITIVAFAIAAVSGKGVQGVQKSALIPNAYDIIGLIIATVGVFLFNWYEEKP